MTKQVYIAGNMLTKDSQLLRAKEREDIANLGFNFYNPMDNKEINSKSELDNNDGLAEKIVKQDVDAIKTSDIIVIEPQPYALGTMVELGQIHGMKLLAKEIDDLMKSHNHGDYEVFLDDLCNLIDKVLNQKVYPHYEDIRRFPGVNESEDRRSLGINQYVYGVCIDLAQRKDGEGFYEWEEILEELKRLKGKEN